MDATAWARNHLETLARRHFENQSLPLETLVVGLAKEHEARWRASGEGRYRPTPAMYALALGWELQRRGAKCGVCHGNLRVAAPSAAGRAGREAMTLVARQPEGAGGLNVPQNLVAGHRGCFDPQ